MKRLVVYTCVTGSYDVVKKPSVFVDWADWRAFSEVDFEDNRYPKLQPHTLFPEYEYSLWIDGNIDIVSEEFWIKIKEQMDEGILYAGLPHPQRDDIYEESLRILKNDREKLSNLKRAVLFLHNQGFPRHYGMNENGVILRKHNSPDVVNFDNMWWDMFCRFSRRDQMSWAFCMWKSGLVSVDILPKGSNVRSHTWFHYTPHGAVYKKHLWRDAVRRAKVIYYNRWLERLLSK